MLSVLPTNFSSLNFTFFLSMLGDHMQKIGDSASLLDAFHVLDEKRSNYISVSVLHHLLTECGSDPISHEEFEALLLCAGLTSSGQIDYQKLTKMLTLEDFAESDLQ